jgi:formylmethanofuran dehydrogenase subunit B
MERAWIAGEPAALDNAIAEAAKLLASSRHPLVAGLGTDVAGARAAVALAERVGAVIDHMHADALLRNLDVMRSSGVLLTTPSEAQVRADTLLVVGTGLGETWPELPQRLFGTIRQRQRDGRRRTSRLLPMCAAGSSGPTIRKHCRYARSVGATSSLRADMISGKDR